MLRNRLLSSQEESMFLYLAHFMITTSASDNRHRRHVAVYSQRPGTQRLIMVAPVKVRLGLVGP